MTDRWFYTLGNETHGPVPTDELITYLTGKSDWRSVHIWREGFTNWQTAGDFAEVAQLIARPPPPPQAQSIETPKPKARFSRITKVLSGLAVVTAAIVGMIIGRPIGKEIANTLTAPSDQAIAAAVQQSFAQVVRQTKPSLPKKIDDLTTMTDVESNGTRMTYRYSVSAKDIPAETFSDEMRKVVVPKVCAANEMKKTLDYGATYEYSYIDSNSKPLGSFVVSSKDCN